MRELVYILGAELILIVVFTVLRIVLGAVALIFGEKDED